MLDNLFGVGVTTRNIIATHLDGRTPVITATQSANTRAAPFLELSEHLTAGFTLGEL